MPEEFELDEELAELESRLREFSPAASKLDQATLLFRAGWEAAYAQVAVAKPRRQLTISKLLAATFAAISAALALMLLQPSTSTPDVANAGSSVAVEDPISPPSQDETVSKAPSTVVAIASAGESMKWPSQSARSPLVGRRDPERWLRATNRLTIISSATSTVESPTTIRDLYRELSSPQGDRI